MLNGERFCWELVQHTTGIVQEFQSLIARVCDSCGDLEMRNIRDLSGTCTIVRFISQIVKQQLSPVTLTSKAGLETANAAKAREINEALRDLENICGGEDR